MTVPRFLQIHTLHPYTAALLNRDDSGLAKRLPYGNVLRTRISSQCLKRHWRMAKDDPHSLHAIDGADVAYRSRDLVTDLVIRPLRAQFSDDLIDSLEPAFQKAVYGEKATIEKRTRQTLLFGEKEIEWLRAEAGRLAAEAGSTDELEKAVADWAKAFKDNIKTMRENIALPGGLTAAMFGRMVTSDPLANIDAAVHVAHAFTVHEEETESDYFTAVDDLKDDDEESGADTIQETELTSGLYYGYVVIDLPGLVTNCGGDQDLAAAVVHNLVYLIAEISPGAKLGSTAPYGRAELMLVEAGDRQPRSLAAAYRTPARHDLNDAATRLGTHLNRMDAIYATGEARRHYSTAAALEGVEPANLAEMAQWTSDRVREAPDA